MNLHHHATSEPFELFLAAEKIVKVLAQARLKGRDKILIAEFSQTVLDVRIANSKRGVFTTQQLNKKILKIVGDRRNKFAEVILVQLNRCELTQPREISFIGLLTRLFWR